MIYWNNTTNVTQTYSWHIIYEDTLEVKLTSIAVLLVILLTMFLCGVTWICRNCILGIRYKFFDSPFIVIKCGRSSTTLKIDKPYVTKSTSYTYMTKYAIDLTLQLQKPTTNIEKF